MGEYTTLLWNPNIYGMLLRQKLKINFFIDFLCYAPTYLCDGKSFTN